MKDHKSHKELMKSIRNCYDYFENRTHSSPNMLSRKCLENGTWEKNRVDNWIKACVSSVQNPDDVPELSRNIYT